MPPKYHFPGAFNFASSLPAIWLGFRQMGLSRQVPPGGKTQRSAGSFCGGICLWAVKGTRSAALSGDRDKVDPAVAPHFSTACRILRMTIMGQGQVKGVGANWPRIGLSRVHFMPVYYSRTHSQRPCYAIAQKSLTRQS
jgi:hypothetical protein